MASGTINGSTSNQYIDAKIVWSSTPDQATNKSTVTASLYYKLNNTGFETSGQGNFAITINGTKITETKTISITESGWVKAIENTVTVSHGTNGVKSISISAAGAIPSTTLTSTAVSGTVSLDTIPRETTISNVVCSTKYFDGNLTYTYHPKTYGYYNRCNIALNLLGDYISVKSINLGKASKSNVSASVTLTEDELSIIYNKIPNHAQGVLRFTIRTYSDAEYKNQIGDGEYKEIQLYIPSTDDTQPTATMTLLAVNSLEAPFNTLYIRGRSRVQATFTNVDGKYGADVESYRLLVDGGLCGSEDPSGCISTLLATEGTRRVSGFVTDTRGISRTYSQDIEVLTYSAPTVIPVSGESEIVCARCDASGSFTESGTYIRIKAKRRYSHLVSGGTQHNFCKIQYRYKPHGGTYSDWATILDTTAASDEVDTGALLGTLDVSTSYSVHIRAIDDMGESASSTVLVPTERIYAHRAGSRNAFAFGKYVEEDDTFDFAEDITVKFRGDVRFVSEDWTSLGLSTNVNESEENIGRWGGSGCYYRVCAGGNHIYVAFNCAFTYAGSAIQVNADPIPLAYRPERNVYAMCATGGRAIARVIVNKEGNIIVDWIQIMSSAEQTTSSTVKWIDGYIDFWT